MIYGAKKGSQQAHKPHIAKDDLISTETLNAMYGLCEGEIAGLADGGKSIRLDGTAIINDNGQPNFDGVTYEFRPGTNDQSYIKGFPSVENEIRVGVELRHDRQYVRAINNKELSAVRLRLNFNALRQQHDNGNITGYAIEYAVDVQTDGGAFVQVLTTAVRGKASSGFKRSHRIDLPKASRNWTIRVRRITPNRDSDLIADTMTVDAITEIIDAKLRYPNTAMLAVSYNAKTFSNIAKIAVRLKGKLIQVPGNYDPVARTYTGLWDGTFKLAYSDNPAWVFYDLCTHKRYGLGERLSGMVDKWRLYQIAQYCDEMVDDGKGGREPRFAINVYIQNADDAYRVLQNIASVFRGLSFWDGSQIVLDSDTPKDPVYTFSPVNVVGEFNYQGTRQRDRHTVAKVAWDNPEHDYATEYEMVRDEAAIAKYGIRMLDINAFGCTSKGQAQRAGLWALKSEQLETRTVSFKTGLMGFIPQVGQIINIADNVFAGRAVSGRILSANARQITLDRTAGKIGDTLSINTDGVVKTAKITSVRGDTLTLDKAIGNADDVWAIVADDLKLMQFRVLTIAQNDDATFDITALQYDRQKYDVVDNGASITQQPYTVLKATPIAAPKSVTITANTRTHQGQAVTTLTINWEQVQGAVAYIVEWRKDDGNWQTLPKVSGQSVDIDGVYSGNYLARVRAVDSFDSESLATSSVLTRVAGKAGKPAKLDGLTVTGGLFSMTLGWIFGAKSEDTNFTEIQVSPDGRLNISTLGTFAYPTNKHEITGLQGNLTQFYRARIVDKTGNVSDWTAWVSGKTEAQADKVLELLTGQITASQLHQDLSTPIGKIGTLESGLNTAKSDIDKAKADIAKAKADIANTRTDLNTAIGNITTERNRISAAIADITTLQSANNAKTQEIANLTQTVGGHTSSIRDLAVTTGDLSQKYSQLKTASDTANSEITAIKQTQSGQATQINTLSSRFDSLSVGGLNYIRDSLQDRPVGGSNRYIKYNTELKTITQPFVFSAYVKNIVGNNGNKLTVILTNPNDNNNLEQVTEAQIINNRIVVKFNTPKHPTNTSILVYANSNGWGGSASGSVTYYKAKVEFGNTATDWSPAPEDIDAQFVQTNANINTLQQTVTSADNALSQRIDALDASYKSADSNINANLITEQKARADADTALSSRITALDASYKSADSALSARVTTAEQSITTANQAIAQTQQTLTAKIDGLAVGGRNLLLNSAIAYSSTAYSTRYAISQAPAVGDDVVITIWGELGAGRTGIGVYNTQGYDEIAKLVKIADGVYQGRGKWKLPMNGSTPRTPNNTHLSVYFFPSGATSLCRIDRIKLERGNVATDWTPAPEDVDSANRIALQQISQVKATADGLSAQYTVKIDNGGRVSGYGLASGAGGISDFAVVADKFYIAPPTGTAKGVSPFMVLTRTTNVNGTSVPAGTYINSAFIHNGSIDIAKINKASINSLSALTANIGHFKSAETGARLEIKDSLLSVYDDNNRLRVRIGLW